jgi:hypothetical protein
MFRVGNLHVRDILYMYLPSFVKTPLIPMALLMFLSQQKTPLSRCLLYVTAYYTRVTFFALGPFWPSTTSKETVSPT